MRIAIALCLMLGACGEELETDSCCSSIEVINNWVADASVVVSIETRNALYLETTLIVDRWDIGTKENAIDLEDGAPLYIEVTGSNHEIGMVYGFSELAQRRGSVLEVLLFSQPFSGVWMDWR